MQDEILVTSESVLVCKLLNIAVKEQKVYVMMETATDNPPSGNTNHGGFSIGKLVY